MEAPPLKVAILWHMHQPDYREPNSDRLAMPWVRLHATKDYLDMPLLAGKRDSVKVTFNLVPSLLDQLDLYIGGGSDPHLDLSRLDPTAMPDGEKLALLQSFFVGNPVTMVDPYPRFKELNHKFRVYQESESELVSRFSADEIRDIQVWSNLVWVDPLFRDQELLKPLFEKGRHYTEEEKRVLLEWQLSCMKQIVPAYRDLLHEGKIEISFTPYYHPILPLLCDTDSALESLPSLTLPKRRFVHPEDARAQIRMSVEKFEQLFESKLKGMWPSEGSISEEVLSIMKEEGIVWTASDQEVLEHSLTKSGLQQSSDSLQAVYRYGNGIKLFFRDHFLSDRIGFVYSGWDADKAAADFVSHLKATTANYTSGDMKVVPVILDGENAWEYFKNDGKDFLEALYELLDKESDLETVTFSQAAEELPPRDLPRIFAGSWINHNFRIWIGHSEDNRAWDLLYDARKTLVDYQAENGSEVEKINEAWQRIYVAEGSDWCWWYGDEHRGVFNAEFDRIFRGHLTAVYRTLGIAIPHDLTTPIHGIGSESYTIMPDQILTSQLDGRVSHYYEWIGAGYFDCLKAGGAMHRVDHSVVGIHFAYDHNRVYIRLDFRNNNAVESIGEHIVAVEIFTPAPKLIILSSPGTQVKGGVDGEYEYACDKILEIAIERAFLWPECYGKLGFTVTLKDDDTKLESWPEYEPIEFEVAERNRELFWPN